MLPNRQDDTDPNFTHLTGASKVEIDDTEVQGQEEEENQPDSATEKTGEQMQTFVFSATLSRDLQQNLKRRKRMKQSNGKRKGNGRPETTLGALLMSLLRLQDMFLTVSKSTISRVFYISTDELLLKLDFRDPEPEVIDLSPEGGVVSTLKESQIECLSADKVCFTFSNHRNNKNWFNVLRRIRMSIYITSYSDTPAVHWCSSLLLTEYVDYCP